MLRALVEKWFSGTGEWDGSDRRAALRARCDLEVEVACPGLRFLGRVLDAGPNGLRIRIRGASNPKVVKKGAEALVKNLAPSLDADLDTIVSKIAWVRQEAPNQFQIGVEFTEGIERLKRSWIKPLLLKSLDTRAKQKRKHLRVRTSVKSVLIAEGERLEVNVRDLSMGGARAESFQSRAEGTHLKLVLKPPKPFGEIQLPVVVRRCQKNLGAYDLGLAFLINEGLKKQLLKLIKALVELERQNKL